ncbi:MAG: hypothetical protein Tsb0015_06000 [Simkaniaceae bacterium]
MEEATKIVPFFLVAKVELASEPSKFVTYDGIFFREYAKDSNEIQDPLTRLKISSYEYFCIEPASLAGDKFEEHSWTPLSSLEMKKEVELAQSYLFNSLNYNAGAANPQLLGKIQAIVAYYLINPLHKVVWSQYSEKNLRV